MLVQRPSELSDTALKALGYLDTTVQRFDNPADLFAHIREVMKHGTGMAAGEEQPKERSQEEAASSTT
jgi:hypothetical protein